MSNEFDDAVTTVLQPDNQADTAQAARSTYLGAVETNPDAFAEAQRVARRVGVPADVAMAMPKEIQKQAAIGEINFDTLAKTSPTTASLLSDMDKAKIAHDDVPGLQAVERTFTQSITEPVQRGFAQGKRGWAMMLRSMGVFNGLDRQRAEVMRANGMEYDPLTEFSVNQAQMQREIDRYPIPEGIQQGMSAISGAPDFGSALDAAWNNKRAVLETTLQSLGTSAPALAMTAAGSVFGPGGTAAGAGLGSFATEYASTLQDVIAEKGGNPSDPMAIHNAMSNPEVLAAAKDKALKRGVPIALFDALTAGIAGKLLAGAKPTVASVGSRVLGETAVQAGGGAVGEATAQAVTGEYKPGDILLEALAELPTGLVEVPGNYRESYAKAQRTEDNAKFLETVNDLASANKVLKRDPETFENFVNQAAENGPVNQVYIDASALMQSGVAEQVAAVSPAVAEQYKSALETGGQIAIPAGEYAAKIAPTEYAQALFDHLKTSPEEFSRAEAADFLANHQEELQQEIERSLGNAQQDEAFKQSTDTLKEKFHTELNALGHHTPDVNKAYATLLGDYFAVNASRLGMTPEELHNQYALKFASELQQGYDQSRVDMHFKDVTKRIEGLTFAANELKEGKISREDYDRLVNELKPVTPYATTPEPSSTEAMQSSLTSDKVSKIGLAASILQTGDRVGLRLDIPAYRDHGTWVVSIHSARASDKSGMAGKAIGYDSVAAVTDARFGINEKAGINIAAGKPKATIATVEGEWSPITPEEAHAKVTEALQDPEWVQVGMDPERHSYFYDRQSMEPVVSADEVIQIGPLLMAKNPVYASKDHFLYQSNLQIDTEAFRNWFGESKVVDAEGKPLVVYHGSPNAFSEFSIDKTGTNSDSGMWGKGFYFATSTEEASRYAKGDSANVMPVFLALKNPLQIDSYKQLPEVPEPQTMAEMENADTFYSEYLRDKLISEGHDGVIYTRKDGTKEIVAFHSTQIKSATGNNGNFDPNDANILHQSAPEGGANAVTGDLDRVNPDVRDAVESRISRMGEEEQQRVRENLEKYKSTSWAAAAIKGMAYREMLERAMVGEDISNLERNAIWGKQDVSATKLIKAFKKHPDQGARVLKLLLNAYDFIGGNRKAENDVSTSFTNCDPSEACAVHCYAANSNARPSEIAKSEFTEFMIEHFPQEMADKIGGDYLATEAGKAGLSLRLNDKGDLSQAQVHLIELLNAKGIAIQVFSKRPELLRSLSDLNLKMLSIDGTNMALASENPDLRLAVTITDDTTEEMLMPIHDRVSVYLPVNLKGKAITKEELKARFPNLYNRMAKENLCPVDGGKLETKPGTSFVDIRDKTADKGVWTCTACDLYGAAGCFKGDRQTNQRKAQTISLSDLSKELQIAKVRKELQSNLETLLKLGGIDGELYGQLSQALSSGQRALLEIADTQGDGRGIESPSGATQTSEGSGSGTGRNAGGTFEQSARGSFNPDTLTISLLKGADLSTFLHETGHYFLEMQFDLASKLQGEAEVFGYDSLKPGERTILADTQKILDWFGIPDLPTWYNMSLEEKRPHHEQFARGFEAYLFEGNAPSIELQSVFQKFRDWLVRVYKSLKSLNVELTDEVRGVFDRMLASEEQIALAEQARSMMPLFTTIDKAPMSADEFREYQEKGKGATAVAVGDLESRGLRDMQWLRNARSRVLKALQKDAKEKRREVQMDVRAEVMSQPVYRAWALLTSRINPEDKLPANTPPKSNPDFVDPSIDSLFAAIGKLGGVDKEELFSTWGVDPAYKPNSGVFGKPVWRKEGGRTIDGMLEALAEHGYLPTDIHGKADTRDFEEAFDRELRGDKQYSVEHDYGHLIENRAGDQVANPGALKAVRFDLGELVAGDYPKEIIELLKARKMVANNGLHPDIIADLIQDEQGNPSFTSGDEMVRALAEAEPPKEAIENLTDVRMLEKYGDIATPDAIEKAADRAIHNDMRAKVVATEANALAKATGQRKVLAEAAKALAAMTISRQKVRNVTPGQYTSAETRAAKSAEKYLRANDLVNAAAEKRNQLFNLYAARAAMDAKDGIEKGLRYLKKFNSDIKGIDADYADQIAAILNRFDLRKITNKEVERRIALSKWLDAQRDAGFEPDIPDNIKDEAFLKSYKDLTVEEFRGLVDSVKQIEHLGRLKKELLTAKDRREFEAVRDEISASIEEHAQGRVADTRTPTTNMGRSLKSMKAFAWAHAKVGTLARILDGGKDGGPVWEYLIRPANERGDWETTMRAEATKALSEIMAPVFAKGKMGGSGKSFPTVGRSFNRESVLAIALNAGNQGNLQRLLGGEGWSVPQIMPILQSLTADEWHAVQAIWDHFESYRPQIAAKERRVYGKEPNWVDPTPFTVKTADGQEVSLRGGYYPIKYDPAASQRAEEHNDAEAAKRQLQGAYTSATTRRSFTKNRVDEVNGRPLLYTLSGMYSGVNDVIHDLAWHEWLIDANRLLRARNIDASIRSHYGPEVKAQFKDWSAAIAEGEKGLDRAGEVALSWLRQGISASGLGFNLMSAMMQPTGITQSISRVGAKWIGLGVNKYLAAPIETAREVNEMSEFMQNRARTRFRELNELRNQVEDQSKFKEFLGKYAYFLMMKCQQAVDIPTWWGAYQKAQAEGFDDERAVALADQAVIDSQGSGMSKDLSAIERSPKLKLFTVFYSYMNTALNLGIDKTMSAEIGKRKAKLASEYVLLYVIPAALGLAIKDALTPNGDDDDDYFEKLPMRLVAAEIDYLMGLMVIVREFAEAAKLVTGSEDHKQDYQGPAGLRMIADSIKFSYQVGQGDFDTAFRKSFINLMGDGLGLPSAQINRTWTGVEALSEGKTSNPAAVAFGFKEQR